VLDTVEAMWNEGWAIKEITEAFGHKTDKGAGPWMSELRKAGRIGYRRQRQGQEQR
jgi:hypothetical protein